MRVLPTSIKSITSKIAAVVLGCSMLVAPGLIASAQAVTTPSTLVTFETTDTTGYALGGSADFGGAASSLSTTPPAGGSTGSTQSAKVVESLTDAGWAGSSFLTLGTTQGLVSDTNKIVTANVYAPVAGVNVRLKLELSTDNTKTVETNASSTTVVGWQTMTFNFANQASGTAAYVNGQVYNKASIFMDFVTTPNKANAGSWYFDDVAFNGATTPAVTIPGTTPPPPTTFLPASRMQATGLLGLVNNDAADAGWAQYYAAGLHYYQAFVHKGSTFTITFHVTDSTGAAAASQAVTLLADKSYASNTATFLSGSTSIADAVAADGAQIPGTTDASGNVSFTLTDTSATAESSSTSTSAIDTAGPGVFGQFALQIGALSAASAEALDIVDIHVLATAPALVGTGLPAARISTPSSGVNGLVDKTGASAGFAQFYGTGLGFKDAFITKASTFTLTWHVVDGTGAPLASQAVTLLADKSYAGNTATFLSGSTPVADAGSGDGAHITGTTDASGNVSFTLTDTSATAEPSTTSTSVVDPLDGLAGSIFGQFAVQVGATAQGSQTMDIVDVHVISAAGGGTPSVTAPSILLTFETGDTGAAAIGSNDFGGSISSVSSAPQAGGSAGSAKSGQVDLHATDASWAGSLFAALPTGENFTSSTHKVVTMNVYSPVAGADMHLKLQVGTNQALSVEMNASAKTVIGWQTMTFNFANVNTSFYAAWNSTLAYNYAFIFADYTGNETTAVSKTSAETFYFDDVAFNGAITPALATSGGGTPPPSSTMVNPTIRLTSPSSFAWTDSATAATWVGKTWYYTGLRYGGLNEQVGSTFALTYHVTDDQGHAAASKTVTLKINKQYSNSTANFTGYPASSPDGSLTGTTDASGNVTFHLTNTNTTADTCSTSAITAPPAGPLYSQITAWINGQATDAIDITDVNIYGCIVTIPSVLPTSRVQATGLLGLVNNDSADSGWAQYYASGLHYFHAYIYQGSTVKLSWHVTDSTGGAAANTAVTLLVNKGCSASTATWSTSVGAVGPVGNGNSPCVDGARVAGTTDASGNITFIFQDTSASGEASSTSTSIVDPTTPGVYGQFALQVGTYSAANAESLDIVDLHILALPSLPSAAGATSTTAPTYVPPTDTTHATTDINGTPTTTTTTPNVGSSSVDIVVAGITVTASGSSDTGTTEPLMPDSSLQVPASGTTNIAAGGFQDSTMVDVYVHSALIYLGRFPTDSSGHLTAAFRIPASLAIGGHTLQIVGLTAGGATVSLAIPIAVVQTVAQAAAASSASTSAAAYAVWLAKQPAPVKATVGARASITSDVKAKTISCSVPATTGSATMAIYYLFVNRHLISAKRFGSLITSPLYPQIDAAVSGADLNSATWAIASSWNTGHIATIGCTVQVGNSMGVVISQSASAVLPRVGKYTGVSSKSAPAPTAVTMRLVSPVMTRDASGKAVDFVDESASPVQDHWSQYYGNANGGLGVFYKYFTAGSTLTLKYHVTDSVSKAALSYYSVWLNVNKNYGGVETATFSYLKNGIAYQIAGHSTDLGETQIPGITDANGDVTFILVNTNDPKSAEPKPAALDQIQPTTVSTTVFSTITLMAHLSPTSETNETKDFIWAHFVQP